MIDDMWSVLTTITYESQQAAKSKCIELGFDLNRGIISLDESYINLNSACDILRDAIEKQKLIQLPISIQKVFANSLESIARYQNNLIAGSDEVVNLVDAIEKLNANIWQYGLHNLSNELLGFTTKLNQLKSLELEAIEATEKLREGVQVKDNLDKILENANKQTELLQTHIASASSAAAVNEVLAQTLETSQKATASLTLIQQTETVSNQLLATSSKSNAEILAFENSINTLVSTFTTLKGELDANKVTQENLFKEFEGFRNTIDGLLRDANRTGMAASFTNRKDELNFTMIAWLTVFACSIIGLVTMGVIYLAPLLESGKLEQLPSRLALTAPFIWLGWLSAKQYTTPHAYVKIMPIRRHLLSLSKDISARQNKWIR